MPRCIAGVGIAVPQWAGLHHRIEHAGLQQLATSQTLHADDDHLQEVNHSCILFDGISLADTSPLPPVALPLLPGTRILALWRAFASWDAPLLCHFSSRAPPSKAN